MRRPAGTTQPSWRGPAQQARDAVTGSHPRAAALVWHEPLMAVGPNCYCGALLREAGFDVPRLGEGRYPQSPVDALAAANLDVLLLPDEPHRFTPAEGEGLRAAIAAQGQPASRRPPCRRAGSVLVRGPIGARVGLPGRPGAPACNGVPGRPPGAGCRAVATTPDSI